MLSSIHLLPSLKKCIFSDRSQKLSIIELLPIISPAFSLTPPPPPVSHHWHISVTVPSSFSVWGLLQSEQNGNHIYMSNVYLLCNIYILKVLQKKSLKTKYDFLLNATNTFDKNCVKKFIHTYKRNTCTIKCQRCSILKKEIGRRNNVCFFFVYQISPLSLK